MHEQTQCLQIKYRTLIIDQKIKLSVRIQWVMSCNIQSNEKERGLHAFKNDCIHKMISDRPSQLSVDDMIFKNLSLKKEGIAFVI